MPGLTRASMDAAWSSLVVAVQLNMRCPTVDTAVAVAVEP